MLKNNHEILEQAKKLYESKEYRTLESLFSSNLRSSYSLEFWHLYIEYVKKVSQKTCSLLDVYEFTISHFEHYWGAADLYREYIDEINKIEDEHQRLEKARSAYLRAFHNPMHNMNALWKDYENFELDNNKMMGRKAVSDALPLYQTTFQYYQVILPYISNLNKANAYKLIDLEHGNRQNLGPKMHIGRLNFIHNYMIYEFRSEEFYFLYSEFLIRNNLLENAKKVLEPVLDTSVFLKIYYGYMSSDAVFKSFVDELKMDVVTINYLNFVLKKQGLDAFRKMFMEYRSTAGPHVFIYVANAEFYTAQNKDSASTVFGDGLNLYPNSEILGEEYFLFLLRIGDELNSKLLFKRMVKTEKAWNKIVEHEFLYGSMDRYKELVKERGACETIKSTLKKKEMIGTGCIATYYATKAAYSFMDLKLDSKNLLDSFINELPKLSAKNNILLNVSEEAIIRVLKEIK